MKWVRHIAHHARSVRVKASKERVSAIHHKVIPLPAFPSGAVLGIFTQGSISPFTSVVFHLKTKAGSLLLHVTVYYAKSGPHTRRVVGVIVVVASVRIDITEIIAVVVIRGTKPPPHRPSVD